MNHAQVTESHTETAKASMLRQFFEVVGHFQRQRASNEAKSELIVRPATNMTSFIYKFFLPTTAFILFLCFVRSFVPSSRHRIQILDF